MLASLPFELVERIVGFVQDVEDVATLNATSRLFHGKPNVPSPVERALRARFGEYLRGSELANPIQVLLDIGRVCRGAQRHTRVVATESCDAEQVYDLRDVLRHISAVVDASGGLHTCGELEVLDIDWVQQGPVRRSASHPALGHGEGERAPSVLTLRRVAALATVRICAVDVSPYHMLALSDAGVVYTCGENYESQLGVGSGVEEVCTPTRIDALRDEHIVCVSVGHHHNLALSATGRVYSWGGALHGRLGHGDQQDRPVPKLIEALAHTRIAGISAGPMHSLVLSTAGAVYSCGHGFGGCLGLGDTSNRLTPTRIEALDAVRVVQVSAGLSASVVVDEAGGAHSFGSGFSGTLGHGNEDDQLVPRRIEALAGVQIVRACTGDEAIALLDVEGGVHTCGSGKWGVLGHGDRTNRLVPTRVQAFGPERVVGLSMDMLHCIAVTSGGLPCVWGRVSAALGDGRSSINPQRMHECVDVPQPLLGSNRVPLQARQLAAVS